MSAPDVRPSLGERIATLLARTDVRRVDGGKDREDVFRLRHDAYEREGAIARQPGGRFTDPVDEAANTFLFGVYIDDVLASSIRITVSSVPGPTIPTAHVFPDELAPVLLVGKAVVDPTRFVADFAASRRHPELPYLTLRLPWMAMEYFEADLMLAAVRPEHEAFYRRLWGNTVWAAARPYPGLSKPVSLTVLDFHAARDRILARHAFFRSDAFERESLFGGVATMAGTVTRPANLRLDR